MHCSAFIASVIDHCRHYTCWLTNTLTCCSCSCFCYPQNKPLAQLSSLNRLLDHWEQLETGDSKIKKAHIAFILCKVTVLLNWPPACLYSPLSSCWWTMMLMMMTRTGKERVGRHNVQVAHQWPLRLLVETRALLAGCWCLGETSFSLNNYDEFRDDFDRGSSFVCGAFYFEQITLGGATVAMLKALRAVL